MHVCGLQPGDQPGRQVLSGQRGHLGLHRPHGLMREHTLETEARPTRLFRYPAVNTSGTGTGSVAVEQAAQVGCLLGASQGFQDVCQDAAGRP